MQARLVSATMPAGSHLLPCEYVYTQLVPGTPCNVENASVPALLYECVALLPVIVLLVMSHTVNL